jgi:hypothetical protein
LLLVALDSNGLNAGFISILGGSMDALALGGLNEIEVSCSKSMLGEMLNFPKALRTAA